MLCESSQSNASAFRNYQMRSVFAISVDNATQVIAFGPLRRIPRSIEVALVSGGVASGAVQIHAAITRIGASVITDITAMDSLFAAGATGIGLDIPILADGLVQWSIPIDPNRDALNQYLTIAFVESANDLAAGWCGVF